MSGPNAVLQPGTEPQTLHPVVWSIYRRRCPASKMIRSVNKLIKENVKFDVQRTVHRDIFL